MATRRVRGDTGALFEVDASMLATTDRERGYRDSSAPPLAREIQPLASSPWETGSAIRLAIGLALVCGAVVTFALAH